MNTIYLVRHGENKANITGEFSYKLVDYSLTPKGIMQARQTAEYFKDKQIDEIYASPLKRAKETAEIIGEASGLSVTLMEHFREVNVGELEGRLPTAENWEFHNRIISEWYLGRPEVAFPEGENYLTLLKRMREGLLEVTRGKDNKRIVIVGHGGIFSFTIQDICRDVDLNILIQKGNNNCSITRLELETKGDSVIGDLKDWASCEHMSGEAAEFIPTNPLAPIED